MTARRLAPLLSVALLACGARTATPLRDAPRGDPVAVRAWFGPVETIAGTGVQGRRGANAWRPEFEGGPAVDAALSRPHFAMADAAGNVYVADKDAHAVRRIAPDGKITTVAGTNESGDDGDAPGPGNARRLSSPNGVWARADGTVYILDLDNSKIRRLDVSGELTTLFTDADGISVGRGLWVSDDEQLVYFASNSAVKRWTPAAGVTTVATGFSSLGNLVVDPNGALVVTDRGGGRVYRLDASGNRTVIAGNGKAAGGGDGSPAVDSALAGVRAVWFDARGGFFLGTHEGSQVWYVDKAGVLHLFLEPPAVSEVRGLSMDNAGNLLVVDDDRGFIRRLAVR